MATNKQKNIIFRSVEGSEIGNCLSLAPGAIQASGVITGGGAPFLSVLDFQNWERNQMIDAQSLPSVILPEIEIGLAARELSRREFILSVKCKNAQPVEVAKVLGGTATDVPVTFRQEVTDTIESLVKDEIKKFVNAADSGCYFLGPFRVAVRLQLNDGTSCTIGRRLLIPNSVPLQVGIASAVVRDEVTLVHCVILLQPASICLRVRDLGSFGYSVSSLEVLATVPAGLWNESGAIRISGLTTIPTTMAGTLTEGGKLEDVSPERKVYQGVLQRGLVFAGTISPIETAMGVSTSRWHKIAELSGLPNPSEGWRLISLRTTGSLKSLFTGQGMPLDFSMWRVPVSGLTTRIAERTLCVAPTLIHPSPSLLTLNLPQSFGSDGEATGCELVEVFVRLADGRVVSSGRMSRYIADPQSGWLREWVYPALGGRDGLFVYSNSSGGECGILFTLADEVVSTSSVSVGECRAVTAEKIGEFRNEALLWSSVRSEESSLFLDWVPEIGPVVPGLRRLNVGDGKLVGVARILPGSISESFPSLYVMGSAGICNVKRVSTGGWKIDKVVSNLSCVKSSAFIECGDSVLVLSGGGLYRLVNNVTLKLTKPEAATGESDLFANLPGASELIGLSLGADSEKLMTEGELCYDPERRYCAVALNGKGYIYDLDRGRWVTVSVGEASTDWMLTYPMDVSMSRIQTIDFFGCRLSEELKVAFYVSDTLGSWRLKCLTRTHRGRIGPLCGSGGRFIRLLILGPHPEGMRITGITG